MPNAFYPRLLQPTLEASLADAPVVCLLGPRQVGKTTLVEHFLSGRHYVSFDDEATLQLARSDPAGFIASLPKPATLDEIQKVPELLPAIKLLVDRLRLKRQPSAGLFLLTGSANLLLLPAVQESLAGRMQVVNLQPVAEMEKQGNSQSLLGDLLAGNLSTAIGKPSSSAVLAEAICAGGYPEAIQRDGARRVKWFNDYLRSVVERDIRDVANIRDRAGLLRLLKLLALRTGELCNTANIAKELMLSRLTVDNYLAVLERVFLLRKLPAWQRNDAKRLIKTPKMHIVDSGLGAALLRLSPADWQGHPSAFGHLLESFVVQQLICQGGWVDDTLAFSYYRDKDLAEVDLVIERGRSVWGVEVKRAAVIQPGDGNGLARLAAQAGKAFCGGMLLYNGQHCMALPGRPHCFAVPISWLWARTGKTGA